MAETVPVNFPSPGSSINVNYDFQDVITNSAYVILYGHTDLAGNRTLIRQRIDSHYPSFRVEFTGTAGLDGEVNFDYEFAVPQKVEGKLYVRVVFFAQATGVQTADCFLKIRILHYDGSTETLIGTQQTTHTVSETEDSSTEYSMATLAFSVNRNFKIGEKLRIEVEKHSTTSTNSNGGFLVDPANKDYGQVIGSTIDPAPSDFVIYMPLNPENV